MPVRSPGEPERILGFLEGRYNLQVPAGLAALQAICAERGMVVRNREIAPAAAIYLSWPRPILVCPRATCEVLAFGLYLHLAGAGADRPMVFRYSADGPEEALRFVALLCDDE